MKQSLLVLAGLGLAAVLNAQITYTTSTTPVTCYGGSDGSATITSISGGFPSNFSTRGLLISEVFTDPNGSDSPFEFVELVATRAINFATTPYTVIFCNNNVATANGWIAGTNRTYAFSITSGSVTAGQVVYVGGNSMIPVSNQIRVINTGTTGGDGGIGNSNAAGVLGNGGAGADGVAVFNLPVASITSSSVPIDAIFFGTTIGSAYVSSSTGYELPVNDMYSGGKLDTTDFVAPNPAYTTQNIYLKASFGVYNTVSNTWTYPRTWITTSTFTDQSSSLLLDGLYNVSWSNSCTSVYNPNLSAGTYNFTIGDGINLVAGNVNVADGYLVALNASASDSLACVGDLIALTANNADQYLWSTGGTLATEYVTVTADTTIYVSGTDTVVGCSNSDTVFIDVNPIPVASFTMPNDTICNTGGLIGLSGSPAGGVFSGTGVTGDTLDPSGISAGIHQVDYTYTDGNGCQDVESQNYLLLDCIGIEGYAELFTRVYPNPASEILWIETQEIDLLYSITDMQGKIMDIGKLNPQSSIQTEDLSDGIYILTLWKGSQIQRMKFMKQ